MEKFEVNIGLEVHIQLNTRSKAFCGDSVQFGQAPNSQISAISLAYPGTLPKLNEAQVFKGVQLALATNSEINELNYFDRKSYFYPDLPKGYQITQDNAPYCRGGFLDIKVNDEIKRIDIHRIHMEEDAGKSIHDIDTMNTVIDLNRAGTSLLELVTEPCMESPEEAYVFLASLRSLIRYLGISDGNMEEGSMRADCNISIRPAGSTILGERCEVKNVNSLKFARKAIEYEIIRQTQILAQGGKIYQTTMDFDSVKGITTPLRDKENAHDYRYFPDPDLPPLQLSESYVHDVRNKMPELPWKIGDRLIKKYGLDESQARIFAYDKNLREKFESQLEDYASPKKLANLFTNKIIPLLQEQNIPIEELTIADNQVIEMLQLIDSGQLSTSVAYQKIFPEFISTEESALEIAQRLDLLLVASDESELEEIIKQVLLENQHKVKAYKSGKKGLLGFFMGQTMKLSKGKVDPQKASNLLKRLLDNQ